MPVEAGEIESRYQRVGSCCWALMQAAGIAAVSGAFMVAHPLVTRLLDSGGVTRSALAISSRSLRSIRRFNTSLGPRIELEKFWPLSLKPFHVNILQIERLYLIWTGCMLRKHLKVLKTRSIWGIKNP